MSEIGIEKSQEKKAAVDINQRTKAAKDRYLRRLEKVKSQRISHGREEWTAFNGGVDDYFAEDSSWITLHGIGGYDAERLSAEMHELAASLHAEGRKLLMLDLMGQGRACVELGADRAITTSLARYSQMYSNIDQVTGDALSREKTTELHDLIKKYKTDNHSLMVAFFRPVGGMSINSLNLYVFRRIYEELGALYDLMDESGIIFTSTIGPNTDTDLLFKILEKTGRSNLILRADEPGKLGIRKIPGIPFPSEIEAMRAFPELAETLARLDDYDASIAA